MFKYYIRINNIDKKAITILCTDAHRGQYTEYYSITTIPIVCISYIRVCSIVF